MYQFNFFKNLFFENLFYTHLQEIMLVESGVHKVCDLKSFYYDGRLDVLNIFYNLS